jgi:hypothetical protein
LGDPVAGRHFAVRYRDLTLIVHCNIFCLSPDLQGKARDQQQGAIAAGKGTTMVKDFEDVQKLGKDNMDVTLRSLGAVSKSAQAIAAEVTDYSKKSFEQGTQAMERLFSVKSLDKAIEVQTDYAKTAYEGFVAQASKLGTLYAELAKETYKPLEGYFARATATK